MKLPKSLPLILAGATLAMQSEDFAAYTNQHTIYSSPRRERKSTFTNAQKASRKKKNKSQRKSRKANRK